jgi:hypothetical protein
MAEDVAGGVLRPGAAQMRPDSAEDGAGHFLRQAATGRPRRTRNPIPWRSVWRRSASFGASRGSGKEPASISPCRDRWRDSRAAASSSAMSACESWCSQSSGVSARSSPMPGGWAVEAVGQAVRHPGRSTCRTSLPSSSRHRITPPSPGASPLSKCGKLRYGRAHLRRDASTPAFMAKDRGRRQWGRHRHGADPGYARERCPTGNDICSISRRKRCSGARKRSHWKRACGPSGRWLCHRDAG